MFTLLHSLCTLPTKKFRFLYEFCDFCFYLKKLFLKNYYTFCILSTLYVSCMYVNISILTKHKALLRIVKISVLYFIFGILTLKLLHLKLSFLREVIVPIQSVH